jgi:hypothetical protein
MPPSKGFYEKVVAGFKVYPLGSKIPITMDRDYLREVIILSVVPTKGEKAEQSISEMGSDQCFLCAACILRDSDQPADIEFPKLRKKYDQMLGARTCFFFLGIFRKIVGG